MGDDSVTPDSRFRFESISAIEGPSVFIGVGVTGGSRFVAYDLVNSTNIPNVERLIPLSISKHQ